MTSWHFSSLLKGRKMQVVIISDWPVSQLVHYDERKVKKRTYQAQVISPTSHHNEVMKFVQLSSLVVDVASASPTACFVREFVHLGTQNMLQKPDIRLVIAGAFVVLFVVSPYITSADSCCVAVANGCPCANESEICHGKISSGGRIVFRTINFGTASDQDHQQEYQPNHLGTERAKMSWPRGCKWSRR